MCRRGDRSRTYIVASVGHWIGGLRQYFEGDVERSAFNRPKQRLRNCLPSISDGSNPPRRGRGRYLRVGCALLRHTLIPISERTARLSQPYLGRPDDYGILVATEEELLRTWTQSACRRMATRDARQRRCGYRHHAPSI
jgi:hypothetical protein